jgi:hypothetical protein
MKHILFANIPRIFLRGKPRPARKADNLTTICEPIFLEIMGSSTSDKTIDLHGLLRR